MDKRKPTDKESEIFLNMLDSLNLLKAKKFYQELSEKGVFEPNLNRIGYDVVKKYFFNDLKTAEKIAEEFQEYGWRNWIKE